MSYDTSFPGRSAGPPSVSTPYTDGVNTQNISMQALRTE